jgi:hypothetical protein
MKATAIRSALAAAGLTLLLAGPAGAEGKNPTPPAKKGCEIQLKGPGAGQSVVYQHGYSFSILAQDNKTHTYTCDDGSWKETVTLTAGPRGGITVPIGSVQVLDSGAAQIDTRVSASLAGSLATGP